MNADYCPACRQPAGVCAICARSAQLHDHVYGEWFCRLCWPLVGGYRLDQDADVYAVEPMSTGSDGS